MNERTPDAYLSLKAMAMYSGLSVRTLRTHLHRPSAPLPSFRIGGKVLVRRSDFDRWAEQFRVDHQEATVAAMIEEVIAAVR
jgi:excisionase family DNA binding protein